MNIPYRDRMTYQTLGPFWLTGLGSVGRSHLHSTSSCVLLEYLRDPKAPLQTRKTKPSPSQICYCDGFASFRHTHIWFLQTSCFVLIRERQNHYGKMFCIFSSSANHFLSFSPFILWMQNHLLPKAWAWNLSILCVFIFTFPMLYAYWRKLCVSFQFTGWSFSRQGL